MKYRMKRIVAMMLAAAMLTGSVNVRTFAEEGETQAVETQAPETQAPETQAPETQAPETQAPETQAPETQAPETQAPETQAPETQAPETQAPEVTTEPQTSAPQTETTVTEGTPETQSQEETTTQTESETETETETEKLTEKETEKKRTTFSYAEGDLTVTVDLDTADALPEKAELKVTTLSGDSLAGVTDKVSRETNYRHRMLAGLAAYRISLVLDGAEMPWHQAAKVTLAWKNGLNLNLQKSLQPEAQIFLVGSEALVQKLADLDENYRAQGFSLQIRQGETIAVAGVENHVADGEELTRKLLEKYLKDAEGRELIANEEKYEQETAGSVADGVSDETDEMTEKEKKDFLKDLSETSVELANARSTRDVTVINVYADRDGKFDLSVLDDLRVDDDDVNEEERGSIDVTDRDVLVNLVAYKTDQELELPLLRAADTDLEKDDPDRAVKSAGRLIVVLTAMDGDEFAPYEGKAVAKTFLQGTYIAPEAETKLEKGLVGALYTDTFKAVNKNAILAAVYRNEGKKKEPERKEVPAAEVKESENVTEAPVPESEEVVTEAAVTEAEEVVTEAAVTEAEEVVTEAEAAVTEAEEAVTEAEEVVTEAEEAVTEAETEAVAQPRKMLLARAPQDNAEQKVQEPLKLTVTAKDKDGKGLAVQFGLYYKEGDEEKALQTNNDGLQDVTVMTAADTGSAELTVDPDKCTTIQSIENGGTLELTLRPLEADPEGYYLTEREQKITVSREAVTKESETTDPETQESEKTTDPETQESGQTTDPETQESDQTTGGEPKESDPNTDETPQNTDETPAETEKGLVSWDKETADFVYEKQVTEMPLTLNSYDIENPSAFLPGGNYTFQYLDAETNTYTALKDAAGTELKVENLTDAGGANAITINAANYPALQAIAKGATLSLLVTEVKPHPTGYFCLNEQQTLTVSRDENGNYGLDKAQLDFEHKVPDKVTLTIRTRADGAKETDPDLDGAVYVVSLRQAGKKTVLLKDSAGKELRVTSEELKKMGHQITLDDSTNPELRPLSTTDGTGSLELVVSELTVPSGYTATGAMDQTIIVTKNADQDLDVSPESLIFNHRKVNKDLAHNIRVNKRLFCDNVEIYSANREDYYAALFSDAARTNRVSDVKKVTMKAGSLASITTVFTVYDRTTYYITETDAYGRPIGREKDVTKAVDPFYVDYVSSDHVAVKTAKNYPSSNSAYTMRNHYFEMPKGYAYTASFRITKNVVDREGNAKATNDSFQVNVYDVTGGKKTLLTKTPITFNMNGNTTSTVKKSMAITTDSKTLEIEEVADPDKKYQAYYNTRQIVLSRTSNTPEVIITNQLVEEEMPSQGMLKLTKKVTVGEKEIRISNTKYYIGVFKDEACTQPVLSKGGNKVVRTFTFKGESSITKELPMDLSKLKPDENITLYFAEVDKAGNKVKNGKTFGYNVTQNMTGYTFDKDHTEAEIIFTNEMLAGGSAEHKYLNPSSGMAPDRAAISEYQAAREAAASGQNTATGDDTPILPLVLALGGSALVILLIVLLLVMRRRRR